LVLAVLAGAVLMLGAVPQVNAGPTERPAPEVGALRVATWNVNGNGTCHHCANDHFSWNVRRGALVQSVWAASPDVLAVQEASISRTHGVRHIDDLRAILAPIGYSVASDYYLTAPHRGASLGAHIFVKTSRVVLTAPPTGRPASGYALMSQIAGSGFRGAKDRSVAWAFLMGPTPTTPTLLLSVHLPTPKSRAAEAARVAVARRLREWATQLAASAGFPGANLVVAGDFNSFDRRQPSGAQAVLNQEGLVDGFAAPVHVNGQYGTTNYTPSMNRYRGYPPSPPHYTGTPTRIDYIMSTVKPLRYEVFLVLDGSGHFDSRYRASDHNMVMVDLPIARVSSVSASGRVRPRTSISRFNWLQR
jgi:endonuclease/exonuclease/phosphatase family metal-dependent hydrolase